MTLKQIEAITALLKAFQETVEEAGELGVPAGPMYAAVMDKMSLDQFEQLMGILVKAGKVHKSGHIYYAGGSNG